MLVIEKSIVKKTEQFFVERGNVATLQGKALQRMQGEALERVQEK